MTNTQFRLNQDVRKPRAKFAAFLAAVSVAACSSAFAASSNLEVILGSRSGPSYRGGYGYYRSWAGIETSLDPDSGTNFAFEPDATLGHLSYRVQGQQGIFDPFTNLTFTAGGTVSSDWENGALRATLGSAGDSVNGANVLLTDSVTFTNATIQPQLVTVRFVIHGSMSSSALSTNMGTYYGSVVAEIRLQFDGQGGRGGYVLGQFGVDSNPANPQGNYGAINPGGWDDGDESTEISMDPGNRSGTFVAHFMLAPGQLTYYITQQIRLTVKNVAEANYANTAGLQIVVPAGVSYTSESGKLLSAGSRLVNIATRANVLAGENVAIGGFIVTGTVPKRVLVRGIGTSLTGLGVAGALADPTLELNQNGTVLATNDNWKDSQESEIQATGIPPGNNLEAAIVRTLAPGSYTAVLRGKNNGTGIGLVEIYDLQSSVDSKLANISTRAVVEASDNVMIGGIIGGGNGSQPRVLIRAIGPSLTGFGVPNALQDPTLELRDTNGALIVSNNDWQSDNQTQIQATGLAPTNPKESAILTTLLPTNYTAIVRGVNNTAGVGLVEVYHLQ